MPLNLEINFSDSDATFMHLKEDHMRNGQLKPAYNIQTGAENEYIVGIGSFSDRNDVRTPIPFLERIRSIQAEGAFGVIKQDMGFRRFLTRGKRKTETQFFLLAFAYNVPKLHSRMEK